MYVHNLDISWTPLLKLFANMKNLDSIIKFLSTLGLSFDQSKIYISLLDQPGVTILELSRNSKISRTNVYRLIDDLKSLGLIDEIKRDGKKLMFPVGAHKLELIVKEQESKVELMRNVLPELSALITSSETINQSGTKVQLYKGVEGVKQMLWNTLHANKECVGFTFRNFKEIVGEKFESDWRQELVNRKLRFRDLVSDSYLASIVGEEQRLSTNNPVFKTKYLPKTTLDITHQVNIYNNVVAYYLWTETEIFGLEVYNMKISEMQKQLFELAWEKGMEI